MLELIFSTLNDNVFANEENQSNCIDIARKRHNAETNTNTLLDIYKMITK